MAASDFPSGPPLFKYLGMVWPVPHVSLVICHNRESGQAHFASLSNYSHFLVDHIPNQWGNKDREKLTNKAHACHQIFRNRGTPKTTVVKYSKIFWLFCTASGSLCSGTRCLHTRAARLSPLAVLSPNVKKSLATTSAEDSAECTSSCYPGSTVCLAHDRWYW